VIAFLRENGQPVRSVGSECVSAEARQREEAERAERAQREREADEAARLRQADERRAQSLAAVQDSRETRLFIALLLLVLSLAAMGAAGISVLKNLNRAAIAAGAAAAVLLIASAWVFLTRPSLDQAVAAKEAQDEAATDRFVGRNACRLQPERSRVTVSDAQTVELNWDAQGCVNTATQYAQDGAVWRRVLVPNDEQAVTVSDFNPASGEYVVSRYLLSARAMEEARRLRRRVEQKACTADAEARLRMADQQRDLVQALPERPNERLVYACAPGGRTG
jgi:hypothetical protein